MLVSVDKAGDLKLGNKKCRLHKKGDIIKVAKMYKVSTPEKRQSNNYVILSRERLRRSVP